MLGGDLIWEGALVDAGNVRQGFGLGRVLLWTQEMLGSDFRWEGALVNTGNFRQGFWLGRGLL
jgi:hypothetical protein